MSTKKLNTMIKRAMLELLREQEEQGQKKELPLVDSKIVDQGAYGTGGRFGGMLETFQKSRAEEDPEGLMKDLGIQGAYGKSDVEKAASVIRQAVSSNEIMNQAFNGPFKRTEGDKVFFEIQNISELSQRNATKYLHLTLLAAENAGILNMDDGVRFVRSSDVSYPTLTSL
jgi:hypothetical protein